jgi:hypothetical protein
MSRIVILISFRLIVLYFLVEDKKCTLGGDTGSVLCFYVIRFVQRTDVNVCNVQRAEIDILNDFQPIPLSGFVAEIKHGFLIQQASYMPHLFHEYCLVHLNDIS